MFAILGLLSLCGSAQSNICSKNVLFTSEVVQLYDQDQRTYTKETSVTFNIGLKETVCFEVITESTGPNVVDKYYLTFNDVESIFTYKNSYDFAVGAPEVVCICDCPGLEDQCSPNRDNCLEDGRSGEGTCYNYYKGEELSDGCGVFSPMGSAEVCCSVSFGPFGDVRYRAFEISTPVTRGSFSLVKETSGNGENINRTFAADLDKGSKLFIESVSVSFETPGKTIPIPDGWYFGRTRSTEVLTNVKINGLNEWDINRLGWLKYNKKGELQYLSTEVQPVFSAEAVNCKENAINVEFASDYSNRDIVEARPLEQYYASTVESARRMDDNRDLVVSFRQFDKLKAMLTFSGELEIIQHYKKSSFHDFTGVALLDKHSNRVLNITVYQAVGTLHGTMKIAGDPVESFDFTIEIGYTTSTSDVQPIDYTNYIQITQWCSNFGKTELCLHTGDSDQEICKVIYCESEENPQFEIPKNDIDYQAGYRESLADSAVWLRYTNPGEWFNGINGLQEATCMLAVLLSVGLLVMAFILICTKTNIRYHIVRCISICPCWSDNLRERMRQHWDISDSSSGDSIDMYYIPKEKGLLNKAMIKLKLRKPILYEDDDYSPEDNGPCENHYEDVLDTDSVSSRSSRSSTTRSRSNTSSS